jgi:hypothetical protein
MYEDNPSSIHKRRRLFADAYFTAETVGFGAIVSSGPRHAETLGPIFFLAAHSLSSSRSTQPPPHRHQHFGHARLHHLPHLVNHILPPASVTTPLHRAGIGPWQPARVTATTPGRNLGALSNTAPPTRTSRAPWPTRRPPPRPSRHQP